MNRRTDSSTRLVDGPNAPVLSLNDLLVFPAAETCLYCALVLSRKRTLLELTYRAGSLVFHLRTLK